MYNTSLCYITRGDEVLMLHRVKKKNDMNHDKWIGIGGKLEESESPFDGAKREIFEETGLTVENPVLCGVKQFQTRREERYVVFLYRADRFSGELRSSDEGEVFWIPREALPDYPLAPDFLDMVRIFESGTLSEFFYDNTEDGWTIRLL